MPTPRALKIRRASVAAADRAGYVQTVRDLADAGEHRGRRIWLFQHTERTDSFVEFIEGPLAGLSQWSVEEHALFDRLTELASYAQDASATWIEVAPPPPPQTGPIGGDETS